MTWRQAKLREFGKDQRKGDLRLRACQWRSQAEMGASAKRMMPFVGTLDVKPMGIRVEGWIVVGREQRANDGLTRRYGDTINLDRFGRLAIRLDNGRIIAQQLLDCIAG